MSDKQFKCDLCDVELKKYYFENVRTICGKCHYKIECAEDIKHELQENKAKALIPIDYKFDYSDIRCNKYFYRQNLTRYQCSIPSRLIKISHWQLSQEINKIKLELKLSSKDKLYSDLINIIIGYTDQQFEYDVKMKHENSYPIHYLID
jgi:hypothetical protein